MVTEETQAGTATREPSWDIDPRLGALEAYVYAYEHRTFEGAKEHLGIEPENASRAVQGFERWLRSPLLYTDDGIVEPLEPRAGEVAVAAYMALETFEEVQAAIAGRPPLDEPSLYRSARSGLRYGDFKVFIAVAHGGSYKDGKDEPDCDDVSNIRKKIKNLDKLLGAKLLEGRGRLRVTAAGGKFLVAAIRIVSLIEKYKEDVSGVDAPTRAGRNIQRWLHLKRLEFSGYLVACRSIVRPNAERLRSIEEAKSQLSEIQNALAVLQAMIGPMPGLNAQDLELDERVLSRTGG